MNGMNGMNNTPPLAELDLTPQDRGTVLMLKLQNYLSARLDEQRRRNDNDLAIEETAKMRGRIAELKALQNLLAAGDSQD